MKSSTPLMIFSLIHLGTARDDIKTTTGDEMNLTSKGDIVNVLNENSIGRKCLNESVSRFLYTFCNKLLSA